MSIAWILEAEVFPESHAAMCDAVLATQNELIIWHDEWLADRRWPPLTDRIALFHGSLGNAATIAGSLPWRPGAFCDPEQFRCSSWYPTARRWLLHEHWVIVPANELIANSQRVLESLERPDSIFVRPDSPLKPFSGRVLSRDALSLRALDHGFYYDDEALPVVVAPVRQVRREWRYVVVNKAVVAGSAYDASRRTALPDAVDSGAWSLATEISRELSPPQPVYVLDLCESDGELHLLELNPFSGADLYACDRPTVVDAVSNFLAP